MGEISQGGGGEVGGGWKWIFKPCNQRSDFLISIKSCTSRTSSSTWWKDEVVFWKRWSRLDHIRSQNKCFLIWSQTPDDGCVGKETKWSSKNEECNYGHCQTLRDWWRGVWCGLQRAGTLKDASLQSVCVFQPHDFTGLAVCGASAQRGRRTAVVWFCKMAFCNGNRSKSQILWLFLNV